jgi:co-chaperonin GroES (HSP10)
MVLVELAAKQVYSDTIVIPDSVADAHPVQKATVLRVGPGKRFIRSAQAENDADTVYKSTEVSPGDRVVFFTAAKDTKQGSQLSAIVGDGFALIRESDILFVYAGDMKVEV